MTAFTLDTLHNLSAGERSIAFLYTVIPGSHTLSTLEDYVRVATGREPNTAALEGIVRRLVAAGVFAAADSAKGVRDAAYRMNGTFAPKALLALVQEATKRGWWPAPRIIAGGLAGSWLGSEFPYAMRNCVDSTQVWQVAETLRTILVGGVSTAFGVPPGARYPIMSVHVAAVSCLLDLLGDEAVLPGDNLSPRALGSLLPVMLELGFVRGADIRALLETARALIAIPGAAPSQNLLCVCCALCVWTGRRDLLRGFAGFVPVDSPAERFAAFCHDVFEDRFAEAEAAFAEQADDLRGACLAEFSTPVWLLGYTLALREGGEGSLRAVGYVQEIRRELPLSPDWHPLARQTFAEARRERVRFVQAVTGGALQKNGTAAAILTCDERDPLQTTRRFFLAGYPTLAALFAANVRAALPGLKPIAEFEAILVKNRAVRLLRTTAVAPAWKTALDEIDSYLAKTGTVNRIDTAPSGMLGWELTLVPEAEKEADGSCLCQCPRLVPAYRGPRGAEDGRSDHLLTLRALTSAKYRELLTPGDEDVLHALLREGYDAHVATHVPSEALDALCGHPRLVERDARAAAGRHTPMTLTRTLCTLTVSRTPDGELVLEMPTWIGKALSDVFAIRRVEPGAYDFVPLPKTVRAVARVLAAHGAKGRLTVPREGVATARAVLEKLSHVMSVSGNFEGGGYSKPSKARSRACT